MTTPSTRSILIVDDDKDLRFILGDILSQEGYHVMLAASGEEALRRLEKEPINLLITDMKMPGLSGHDLFEQSTRKWPHIPVVIMTAHGNVDEALQMIRQGAYDYIAKPYNTQDLLMRISRALEREQLVVENRALRKQLQLSREHVFGDEPVVKEVLARVDAVAVTDFPVVLMGESGTGKEVLAREIHLRSARSGGPFVPVNCGAIPRELFESELFGHMKGAFTGATADRKGLFEEASRGTLFLDEISEIAAEHQVKLLRAIQEGEVKRVGDNLQRSVDVRIIAATNRDLAAMVQGGTFREDLYYRICVMPIRVPPLRERRGDILPLALHFLQRETAQSGRGIKGFTRSAMDKLLTYSWRGNIRELENKVKQALILAPGEMIDEDDLMFEGPVAGPAPQRAAPPGQAAGANDPETPMGTLTDARQQFERHYLIGILKRHRGNATNAAKEAGKHRSEFYYLLKKHGLTAADYREDLSPTAS
jgi:DNA-binding NtrC family response regulator